MGNLTVVRAGAGSGKTFDLCRTIAEKVAGGLDPARILATTFTKKAAAELKGRIQQRLLEDERLAPLARLEKAERLERAAIGTVHSVGHQLLSRYALHLGLSPRMDVLDKPASELALRDLLVRTHPKPWEPVVRLARRLSIAEPQGVVLELLAAQRSNRIDEKAFRTQMQHSADRLCEIMAPGGPQSQDFGFPQLYALVDETLAALKSVVDETKVTADATRALRQLSARKSGVWIDFLSAGSIKAGKRSGADDKLAKLRGETADVLALPALHADVRAFLAAVTERAVALQSDYQAYKQERGLLDFTDLETLLLELLETPALAASLQREFDFVVVDEFQDTNPLQLAIFQRLRALAPNSRWVGDSKQAIYGFRGTDPELVRAVWDTVPLDAREELPKNYRSQQGLVQFVGKVFAGAFGPEAALDAHRDGRPKGVERWLAQAKNNTDEFLSVAAGLAQLNTNDGIALGNIAVLMRTNNHAAELATACSTLGLPVLLALPGLLATREAALVRAGLRLVADRWDGLAAAEALHILGDATAETPDWLPERLRALKDDTLPKAPWHDHALLGRLADVSKQASPPSIIVQQVIDALRVGDHLRAWGDAARRMANLDTLVAVAQEYEQSARSSGSAATLTGLLAHLAQIEDDEADPIRPPYGVDAITILTYHGAKGLEWPVVVLADLNFDRAPDMWSPKVEGPLTNPADPLADRRIRYWPWPFGRSQFGGRLRKGSGLEQRAPETEEGQRASELQIQEGLRVLYVGFTRARDKLVLAHRDGPCAWLSLVPEVDRLVSPKLPDGEHVMDDVNSTCVVKRLSADMAEDALRPPPTHETWLVPLELTGDVAPSIDRYHTPSGVAATGHGTAVATTFGAQKFTLPSLDLASRASFGTAVHGFFAAWPSTAGLTDAQREAIAARCLRAFGAEALLPARSLVEMGAQFQRWVDSEVPGAAWRTEVPVTAPREDGGQWDGIADLLLYVGEDEVVIVDHKSSPVDDGRYEAKAGTYDGQLQAYREALAEQGLKVRGMWIHFPLAGVVARVG